MAKPADISVIIVSFNTADILCRCLSALFLNPGRHSLEVIVVDNNSSDGSAGRVKALFPQVRVMENALNKGFAAANNQAWKEASGRFILLLNPDAFVMPGAVDSAAAFMQSQPDCGLCGGLLLNPGGHPEPSARRFPGAVSKFLSLTGLSAKFPKSRLLGRDDFAWFDHKRPCKVDWVPGTFTLYRREMLESIGFFDERFFLYYEETDLSLRARRAGWKVYFTPHAKVVHIGGASSRTRKDQIFDPGGAQVLRFRLRSEYLYFWKNYSVWAVLANAGVEVCWHLLRMLVNSFGADKVRTDKRMASRMLISQACSALSDTSFGRVSPPVPW